MVMSSALPCGEFVAWTPTDATCGGRQPNHIEPNQVCPIPDIPFRFDMGPRQRWRRFDGRPSSNHRASMSYSFSFAPTYLAARGDGRLYRHALTHADKQVVPNGGNHMSKKAAEHHKKASEHLTHAARPPRGSGQALRGRKSREGRSPCSHSEGPRHSSQRIRRRGGEGSHRRARQKVVPRDA